MKMSPEEKKEYAEPTMAVDAPAYPWGLCVRLDEDAIAKLGIKKLPAAGEMMQLMARVEVRSVGLNDSKDGGENRNMELQITDMALGADEKPSKAKPIYGG